MRDEDVCLSRSLANETLPARCNYEVKRGRRRTRYQYRTRRRAVMLVINHSVHAPSAQDILALARDQGTAYPRVSRGQ